VRSGRQWRQSQYSACPSRTCSARGERYPSHDGTYGRPIGDIETIWVVDSIDRTAHTSAYSHITIGHHAGTVKVDCTDRANGRCLVTVNYEMTNLNPEQPEMLDAYNESSFKAMMNEWAIGVTATLDQPPATTAHVGGSSASDKRGMSTPTPGFPSR
jgi:hypothetical protein